jgi:PTS system mannose-specific IIA component
MKLGVVVVTHGQLATELVNSAEMIVGDLPNFAAVSIGWHEDVDHAREEIGRAIERCAATAGGTPDDPASVLVLTDMFGGTPANLAVTYVSPHVEVITGVNLPMLIKLARPHSAPSLLDVAREMREHGRHAIWVASDLLRGEKA